MKMQEAPERNLRLVDPDDLMGNWEVSEALGVKPSNLQFIQDLPEPAVTHLKRGQLWDGKDIREFAAIYKLRQEARRAAQRAVVAS